MQDPTLSLSMLLILATVSPSEMIRVATFLGDQRSEAVARRNLRLRQLGMPALYGSLAIFSAWLSPVHSVWGMPSAWWIVLAILLGPLMVLVEIGVMFLWLLARGERPTGVSLHSAWIDDPLSLAVSTAVVGSAEEVIFRGVWVGVLILVFDWPALAAILLAAVAYGFNHWYFGPHVVVQKCVSGLVYGVMFVVSGYLVLTPLIVHALHNVSVAFFLKRQTR